jgi:hypothetical protein
MVDTEMIVMEKSGTTVVLTDYYSTAFQQPTQKTSTSLNLISSTVNSTGIFGVFTRYLSPQSSQSTAISVGLTTSLSFAYLTPLDKGFQQHDHAGVGIITFGSNNNTSNFIPNVSNVPYLPLDSNFYIGWQFFPSTVNFTFNVL